MSYLDINTYPFDDSKATYDEEMHRYYPTKNYIKEKTGIDMDKEFKNPTEGTRNNIEICDKLYDIILDTANPSNLQENMLIKEYKWAKDHNIRQPLIDALVVYIRASVVSTIDVTGDEHAKNYDNSSRIEFKDFDDLSVQAKRKLKQTTLFYTGKIAYSIKEEDVRNGY